MNNKITLIAILLNTILFTGCNTETNHTQNSQLDMVKTQLLPTLKKEVNPHTPIIGTWEGNCHYQENDDESYQAELTFALDASYTYSEKTYPTANCSGDYTLQHKDIGTYALGDRTRASDGEVAYDFEIHTLEEGQMNDEYFMIRFTNKALIFTDEKHDYSQPNGETPLTRNNFFSDTPRMKLLDPRVRGIFIVPSLIALREV